MQFRPSYLPLNKKAFDLVKSLAETLGLKLNKKHNIVLASFLAVAKAADGNAFEWLIGKENQNLKFFRLYPNVGAQVISKVRTLLMEHGFIWDWNKINDEHVDKNIMEVFNVDADEFALITGFTPPMIKPVSKVKATIRGLDDAIFVEANLPFVLVNQAETWEENYTVRANANHHKEWVLRK